MDLVLFPNQLFRTSDIEKVGPDRIFLVEHPLFFKQDDPDDPSGRNLTFSTVRLVFARATMSAYSDEIRKAGYENVERIEWKEVHELGLKAVLLKRNLKDLIVFECADKLLEDKLQKTGVKITWKQTPNFLLPKSEYPDYLKMPFKDHYFQTNFYKYMRESRNILMTKTGGFEGGKLTFDSENRKPMPNDIVPPSAFVKMTKESKVYIDEATEYVKRTFGLEHEFHLVFPITRKAAEEHLDMFLKERFDRFGPYQDAIRSGTSQSNLVLFHSGISSALNVGLLEPNDVVEKAVSYKTKANIASVEGFIRQVIGWREFIRFVYETKHDEMVGSNQLEAQYSLDSRWYTGSLGIAPVDDCIKVAFKFGYLHHILRLMIIANFMTIAQIHPREMYRWFMEFSLDSYDWVMLPNVHGMASYSSSILSTKPYISSSNYVLKMSNYKKDGKWDVIWDALYNNFLLKNEPKLTANGRMFFMLNNVRKKSDQERQEFMKTAEAFLATLQRVKKRKLI